MTSPVLECRGVDAGYNGRPVVRAFDLAVEEGEVIALLGPNGAGKTTLLLTLAGLLPRVTGTIQLDTLPMPTNGVAANRRGVVLVPDDRSLFRSLTAVENLKLASRGGSAELDRVIELFPELRPRMGVVAGMLSGGEQQMLAIGRALAQRPRLLLIDELSMGLAPLVVDRILHVLRDVADASGVAIVLVEQHVKRALEMADQAVVIAHGRTFLRGTADELLADLRPLEQAYLG